MAFIQLQLRNDTASVWTTANPILAEGEMGIETDTKKFKIGDGTTAWTSLAYGGGGVTSYNDLTDTPTLISPSKLWYNIVGDRVTANVDFDTFGNFNVHGSISLDGDSGTAGQILSSQGVGAVPAWIDPATGPAGAKGDTGDTGPAGAAGAKGDTGDTGAGVPAGGSTGQILSKIDSTDFNTQWIAAPISGVSSFNTRTGAITLTSGDVTTALTFTPYDAANPSGYTSNTGTVTSVAVAVPSHLSVSGSPVTGSGTITIGLSGTALPVVNGGTGLTSVGTSGNVLTSDGTGWVSSAPSGGGGGGGSSSPSPYLYYSLGVF